MPAGGSSQFTYNVIIDASTAEQAAARMREIFESALKEIDLSGAIQIPAAQARQITQPIERQAEATQRQAKQTAQTFEAVAQIDLTKPVDDLRQEIEKLQRDISETENQLQNMAFLGDAGPGAQHSARYSAQLEDYYRNVESELGREAANIARYKGVAGSIGDVRAQFVGDVKPIEEYETSTHRQVEERARFTLEEQRQSAELESEIWEKKLAVNRAEQEILRRQLQNVTDAGEAFELNEDTAQFFEALGQQYEEYNQELKRFGQEEQELIEALTSAKEQARRIAAEEAEKAEQAAIKALPPSQQLTAGAGGGGPVETTRQTAITVTKASADNARRLADALDEAAKATERLENAQKEQSQRARQDQQAELQQIRDRLRLQQQTAQTTERLTQQEITDAAQKRAAIEQANRAQIEAARTAQEQQRAQIRQTTQIQTQAARTAGQQQRAQIQQTTSAQRAYHQQQVTATRTASQQVIQQARAQAQQQIQLSRTAAQQYSHDQQRLTALYRQELRERDRLHRQSMQQQRTQQQGGALGGMFAGFSVRGAIAGGLGALGIYGVQDTIRRTYEAGEIGAQQLRMAETFDYLAQRIGVDAAEITEAIENASNQTVTEMEAIAYGAQLISQRFAEGRESIPEDISVLIRASRRLSQIYTDEQGDFLSTQEVFSRLVKFFREGNKELVDQFGLSNARIAEYLEIEKEGLASAEGAALRYAGTLGILTEELERFGEATDSLAEQIEQQDSRYRTAVAEAQQELGPITLWLATQRANIVAGLGPGGGGLANARPRLDRTIERLRQAEEPYGGGVRGFLSRQRDRFGGEDLGERRAQAEMIRAILEQVAELENQGFQGLERFDEVLTAIIDNLSAGYPITQQQRAALEELTTILHLAADGGIVLAEAQSEIADTSDETRAEIADMADEMRKAAKDTAYLIDIVRSGGTALDSFGADVDALAGKLANLRAEAGPRQAIIQGLGSAAEGAASRLVSQGLITPEEGAEMLNQALGRIEAVESELRRSGVSGPALSMAGAAAEADIVAPFEAIEEQNEANRRAGEEARREWERAAKETEREFKRAAQESAKAFESALEGVPGLFGTSDVTEEDMQLAELGFYEDKADEYLRRLSDEVLNKKEYGDVDIYDAARRAGIDPGLPPEAILARFRGAWESGALFADTANLDLFNRDAVMRSIQQQQAGAEGRENIIRFFGFDPEIAKLAGLTTAGQSELIGGDSLQLMRDQAGAPMGAAVFQAMGDVATTEAPAYVATVSSEITGQLADPDVIAELKSAGGGLLAALFTGYTEAAASTPWLGAIRDEVTAQVLETLGETIQETTPAP